MRLPDWSAAAALMVVSVLPLPRASAQALNGPMSSTPPASAAAPAPATPGAAAFDVNQLFANTCGWCHSSGGREPGRGPKLMDSALTDAEIVTRIKVGKTGAMPAFGGAFSADQLQSIVRYIRELKPAGAPS